MASVLWLLLPVNVQTKSVPFQVGQQGIDVFLTSIILLYCKIKGMWIYMMERWLPGLFLYWPRMTGWIQSVGLNGSGNLDFYSIGKDSLN